jgi:hypothetical protein
MKVGAATIGGSGRSNLSPLSGCPRYRFGIKPERISISLYRGRFLR